MAGPDPDIHIKGLKEFRDALKDVDRSWGKTMGQANKAAADIMAQEMSSRAGSGDKRQRASANSIRAVADQLRAKVRGGGARYPFAAGAFFGARYRSGWYAQDKYAGSTGKQFLPWVGNQWDPGDSLDSSQPQGAPYVLSAAIYAKREDFIDAYGDIITRVLSERAFDQ